VVLLREEQQALVAPHQVPLRAAHLHARARHRRHHLPQPHHAPRMLCCFPWICKLLLRSDHQLKAETSHNPL
jgi:hypothetical protein